MGGFSGYKRELAGLNASIVAATAEPREKAQEVADQVNMPIAYGVTREQADAIGAWWEDRRQIMHATDFVLAGGKVLSATYSTGPIGRLEPADAIRFIQFQERLKNQA